MRKQPPQLAQALATIVGILVSFAMMVCIAIGYVKNILVLLDPDAVMTTGEFIMRMIGVFPVPIIGTLMGWFA